MMLLKSAVVFALTFCCAVLPLPAQTTSTPAPAPNAAPSQGSAPTGSQTAPPATNGTPGAASTPAVTQSQGAGDQPQFTITTRVDEVDLSFSVTDRHGKYIDNLQLNDFALLDNGRAPAQIYRFERNTNLPLRIGILIDTSTSIRERFSFEQQAATEFLLQILRPRSDKGFIEGFDIAPDFTQNWTSSLDQLTSGIEALHSGGGTALFDALYTGCHEKMLDATQNHEPARKAIVLISDGDDNQSHAYLADAIKECQRAETSVYAISTNVSPSRDRGDDTLQKIADATGGRAFYPNRVEDMPVSFSQIQDELRSQYELSYKPADFVANGAFRTIYLFCLDRKYQVHGRTGYFAPRE